MSLNKFIGIGRMTKDAELKFTSEKGTAVATFTIAIDDGYGDRKTTSYIPIVVWGKAAEAVANYTHKGSLVMVQGKVNTRSYDAKDGTKRYVTEIIADNFNGIQFLDSKGGNTSPTGSTESFNQETNSGEGFTEVQDDGDIPF